MAKADNGAGATLDRALCTHCLGMGDEYWRLAGDARAQLENHPACAGLLEAMHEALCRRHDAALAGRLGRQLIAGARVFCPAAAPMAIAAFLGGCLPHSLAHLASLSVPRDVVRDTLHDFERWAVYYRQQYGVPGLEEIPWVFLPHAGRMVQLGRLMYEPAFFEYPYLIYAHRESGAISILAMPGLSVTADGLLAGTNGRALPAAFTTALVDEGGHLTGHFADGGTGRIQPAPAPLPLRDHELLLAPGLPVLNLHIPAQGGMAPQDVDASLGLARAYFAQRGFPCEIAACESWLLDAGLADFLPGEGNVVRFMRRFAKFPSGMPRPTIGKYVFPPGFVWPHWQGIVPATSLQRRLVAHLAAGGQVVDSGGILRL